uniref:Gypsy retrotransposon integrase-like protein 1 n=1 Tax=Cajanus cajan TaxID=3821 RepID=A0A151RNE8_CAJCA|nr:Gypsy retrotransposon integrase-like protein 1 [Cajanus cajan]
MAAKVLRAGYYWPTLKEDCANFVKKCVQCQKHGNLIHASAAELHSVSSPCPFSLWGINVLGPFPMAKGQVKFLVVAVDYFIKWIEAEPLACISATNVQKFVWKSLVTPTKETPFRLTYGADAMIPVEVGEPSFRRQHFHEESNNASLRAELDVLDETREKAQIVAEACKQRMTRRFNSNVKPRTFHKGNLVATFSISWYRVSESCRNRLTKYMGVWVPSFSCTKTELIASSDIAKYTRSGLEGSDLVRFGGVAKVVFKSTKASSQASFRKKDKLFGKSFVIELILLARRGKNLDKATNLPDSRWNSLRLLGLLMSRTT